MVKPNLFPNLTCLDLEYCSKYFFSLFCSIFAKWWMMLFMSKFLQFFVCFYRKFQIHFSYLWDVASKNRPRFKLICFAHLLMRVLWFQRNILGACRFLKQYKFIKNNLGRYWLVTFYARNIFSLVIKIFAIFSQFMSCFLI